MAEQISEHEIRVYEAARRASGWLTARELAVAADVADRTARHHASRLAAADVFEVAELFGGFRYRIASSLSEPGRERIGRLEAAKRIMGG